MIAAAIYILVILHFCFFQIFIIIIPNVLDHFDLPYI